VAYALSPDSDVRFGPVAQYTASIGPPGGFLETTEPYGAGRFGAAGLRASLLHDSRDRSIHPRRGANLDVSADYFPAIWDVQGAFGAVRAGGGVYVTLPVPLKPFVGLQLRGQRVFGDFPFHQAAFIGGRGGVRTLDPQRYAGDASLSGKLEMRVPLFKFYLLLPLNTGVFAAQDVGRVYREGASPGGWHRTFGAGFWVGFHEILLGVRVLETDAGARSTEPALRHGAAVGVRR
jgi:hemolysin activation/secretion protein